jgi:hypothetical protein
MTAVHTAMSEGSMATMVGESQWTKSKIATLSDSQLACLNYDEMVKLVLVAGIPVRNVECIRTMEGDTLVRLVNFARVCCRRESLADTPTSPPKAERERSRPFSSPPMTCLVGITGNSCAAGAWEVFKKPSM